MKRPYTIHVGDCREVLATLPEQHFHCCVTSPPYFGLRDYGVDGQIGLEPTPDDFVAAMVEVFRGVWRVLRDDGVCWVNLGDSYASNGRCGGGSPVDDRKPEYGRKGHESDKSPGRENAATVAKRVPPGLKPKDLIGQPWRVAFALQSDGWYLRDAVIWHKPAPMPGSQRDRCTSSYEFIFQLTKKPRYFFDLEAVKEGCEESSIGRQRRGISPDMKLVNGAPGQTPHGALQPREYDQNRPVSTYRTPRNVWKIAHEGFSGAHFATFPRELPMRCIKASTSEKGCCPACGAPWVRVVEKTGEVDTTAKGSRFDSGKTLGRDGGGRTQAGQRYVNRPTGWDPGCECRVSVHGQVHYPPNPVPCRVLDPFGGAGTTAIAACLLGRECDLIELNQDYADLAESRIAKELKPSTARTDNDEPAPLFSAG